MAVDNDTVDESMFDMGGDIATAEEVPLLPRGEYDATIVGFKKCIKQETGNRYASITYVIAPEAFPPDYSAENAPDGMKLTWNGLSLNPNARARRQVREFHEAHGVRAEGSNLNSDAFIGVAGRVRVDHDDYQGKKREKISGFVKNV